MHDTQRIAAALGADPENQAEVDRVAPLIVITTSGDRTKAQPMIDSVRLCALRLLAVAEEMRGRGARVLLAEDNPVNMLLASTLLRREGYSVTTASNGEEVLGVLSNSTRPDLIIMDVEMPILDGLETTRCIRRKETDRSLSRIPILALTANAQREDIEACLSAGMDGYLSKPFDRDALDPRQVFKARNPAAMNLAIRFLTAGKSVELQRPLDRRSIRPVWASVFIKAPVTK